MFANPTPRSFRRRFNNRGVDLAGWDELLVDCSADDVRVGAAVVQDAIGGRRSPRPPLRSSNAPAVEMFRAAMYPSIRNWLGPVYFSYTPDD
jgi:hypothetical protein